jgi:hypothetical protein
LRGTLAAAGAVSFLAKSRAVASLPAGRYTIIATGHSSSGFIIQELRRPAIAILAPPLPARGRRRSR